MDEAREGGDLLQQTPEIASELTRAFVRGVMTFEGRIISMLGIEALMPEDRAAA